MRVGAWNLPTNSWVPVVRFDGASVYFVAAASGWHVAIQAVLSKHVSRRTTGVVWVGVGVTRRAYHLAKLLQLMHEFASVAGFLVKFVLSGPTRRKIQTKRRLTSSLTEVSQLIQPRSLMLNGI